MQAFLLSPLLLHSSTFCHNSSTPTSSETWLYPLFYPSPSSSTSSICARVLPHLTYSISLLSLKNPVYVVFTAFLAEFSLAFTSEIVFSKVPNNFPIILCLVLGFIDPHTDHILYKHYKLINMLFLKLLGHYSSFVF